MKSTSIAAYELPVRVASYDADMDAMHPNRHKMVSVALEKLAAKNRQASNQAASSEHD